MTHRVKVKLDANHHEIVAALKAEGYAVQSLAAVGHGCPDILVCDKRGELFLAEIKMPGGRNTPAQMKWQQDWMWPVYTVRSVKDALAVCAYRDALKSLKVDTNAT